MLWLKGMKYREISVMMNKPINTVKAILHQAKEQLWQDLAPTPGEVDDEST